ncbi:hypothetical protein B0T24DRAFT_536117 [Lasiosphaeria ovina]|uniref:Methyltransferase type 11 domain-containing protein n=1 Tax=Lasiosphaeria ovina TaxID=92902 RepID=A0AAE0N0C4_9PEZI|nr:hypothetical protein B0T24DRAFT_536117 [Lasiosphaeria ovina]
MIDQWYTAIHNPNSPLCPPRRGLQDRSRPLPIRARLENPLVGTPANKPRPRKAIKAPQARVSSLATGNPNNWKPLVAPDRSPTSSHNADNQHAEAQPMSLDFTGLQGEIKRMDAASPATIVAKLNEGWGSSNSPLMYKELEMEKRRWLLSALRNLDKDQKRKAPSVDCTKVLALFESEATASYLAARYAEVTVTHVAPSPLPLALFPNVEPLFSSINATPPVAPDSYASVYCMSLPSKIPSREIPQLLQNIYRCLAPNGVLHLALIDSTPTAESVGPRMRQWLDKNLVANLEPQYQSTSIIRFFNKWLADAELRGYDSIKTTVKFRAVHREKPDNAPNAELRTALGRKLWQDTWGPFVRGNSWWWEDKKCVEECDEIGTYWKYWLIEAVKEVD